MITASHSHRSIAPALEVLLLHDWVMGTEDGQAILTLPADVKYSFPTHVNKGMDAKDHFKKQEEKERVARGLGRVPVGEFKSIFTDARTADDISKSTEENIAKYKTAVVN